MEQRIDLGDFVIDKDYRTVVYKNNKIDLSKRLFDLLFLLAERNNMFINKHKIFNDLWGSKNNANIRTVDSHICKLRKLTGVNIINDRNGCFKLVL